MKLLLCKKCQDIIRLIQEPRKCLCGAVSGHYLDDLNAVYSGEYAIPLGISNDSLVASVVGQPEKGEGNCFKAFVIPKQCPTFWKTEENKEQKEVAE